MKTILFTSLFLVYVCCQSSPEQIAGTVISNDSLHSVSDSLEVKDFWRHMQVRKASMSPYILPDTAYRFRLASGWGEFDLMCSIYAAGPGEYHAQTIQMINPFSNNDISYRETDRPIDAAEWKAVRDHFVKSGFWQADPQFDHTCVDCTNYQVWAKEGSRNRMIGWNCCQDMSDSIIRLALYIQSDCGYPEYEFSRARYAQKGDTLFFHVPDEMDQQIFLKSSWFEVGGTEVEVDSVTYLLKLTGDEDSLLHSIYFVRNRLDGSIQKKLIQHFQKVPLKMLLQ